MRNIGSTNNIKTFQLPKMGQNTGFIGPTGSTGPMGTTGNTGTTGGSGATGIGVIYAATTGTDGITVYLNDNTSFDLIGLSGAAPSFLESFTRFGSARMVSTHAGNISVDLSVLQGITIPTDAWGKTVSSVSGSGMTAYFVNLFSGVTHVGISLYYNGDDIVFHGITSQVNLGQTGSILGAFGTNVFGLIDSSLNSVFRYEVNTIGITTNHLLSGVLQPFIQANNISGITNLNTTQVSNIGNYIQDPKNISTNFFYISGNTWTNTQFYSTDYSGITSSIPGISGYVSHDIFNTSSVITFGKRKVGSCCYCENKVSGKKTCLDYASESYCLSLSGTFSFNSCANRRGTDCDDWGACCKNGTCVNIDQETCRIINGNFYVGSLCSESPPPCL